MNRHGTSLRIFSMGALVCLLASVAVLLALILPPLLGTTCVYSAAGRTGAFSPAGETETVRTLNEMTAEEYQAVSGIGPALSGKILTLREEAGGFRFAEDLMGVDGIGKSKYRSVMEFIDGLP